MHQSGHTRIIIPPAASGPKGRGRYYHDTIDLTGMVGRYVTLDFRGAGEWLSLNEIRFYGDPVPEPATVALLGLAIGSLGAYLRRRR